MLWYEGLQSHESMSLWIYWSITSQNCSHYREQQFISNLTVTHTVCVFKWFSRWKITWKLYTLIWRDTRTASQFIGQDGSNIYSPTIGQILSRGIVRWCDLLLQKGGPRGLRAICESVARLPNEAYGVIAEQHCRRDNLELVVHAFVWSFFLLHLHSSTLSLRLLGYVLQYSWSRALFSSGEFDLDFLRAWLFGCYVLVSNGSYINSPAWAASLLLVVWLSLYGRMHSARTQRLGCSCMVGAVSLGKSLVIIGVSADFRKWEARYIRWPKQLGYAMM